MAYSLSSLIKLTREELANIVLDYQHKFDNSLGSINVKLLELKNLPKWNPILQYPET